MMGFFIRRCVGCVAEIMCWCFGVLAVCFCMGRCFVLRWHGDVLMCCDVPVCCCVNVTVWSVDVMGLTPLEPQNPSILIPSDLSPKTGFQLSKALMR